MCNSYNSTSPYRNSQRTDFPRNRSRDNSSGRFKNNKNYPNYSREEIGHNIMNNRHDRRIILNVLLAWNSLLTLFAVFAIYKINNLNLKLSLKIPPTLPPRTHTSLATINTRPYWSLKLTIILALLTCHLLVMICI